MEALECIFTRRSIRRFGPEKVSPADLETILRAAMAAPSAMNEQPWHFVVVEDRRLLDEITGVHPYSKMLLEAPLAIVVCGDLKLECAPGYWSVDCSAATQNLLLAAHALGLGAVWLGVYPRKERIGGVKKLFALPENIMPLAIVALGRPAERKGREDRYQPERIHVGGWSGEA